MLRYSPTMDARGPFHGELQTQIMTILWRVGQATVEQTREELPVEARGAYTTVQTVLNRLADRGLLARKRIGRGFVYEPTMTEQEYLLGSISRTLGSASADARRAALAELVGGFDEDELAELRRLRSSIDADDRHSP
jgi:predicted transcriptional regulator